MTSSSEDGPRADLDDVAPEDATWIAALLDRAVSGEEPSVDLMDRALRRVEAPNGRAGHLFLAVAVAVFVVLIGGFAIMRPTPSSDLGPLAPADPSSDLVPPATSTATTDPGPPAPPDTVLDSKRDSQVAPFADEPTSWNLLELVSFTRNGDGFDVTLRWDAEAETTYVVLAATDLGNELASTEIVASATGPAQVVLHIPIAGLAGLPPDGAVRYSGNTPAWNGGGFPLTGPRTWVPDTTGLSSEDAVELMRITGHRATVEASGSCASGTVCSTTPEAGSAPSANEYISDQPTPVALVTGR